MKAIDKIGTKLKLARKFAEYIDDQLTSEDQVIDSDGDFSILRFSYIHEFIP